MHDRVMPIVVAPLSAITHIVTDAATSDPALAPYQALGIEVLCG